tara:strand:+ start:11909 stop:12850 length:942 start_codon:yes stop_codon:yes gene_type:complete
MTRQNINIGSSANDGTGDTLRSAGSKINQNFQEIYTQLGGDSSTLTSQVILKDSGGNGAIIFEGTSTDSHETKLIASNVTADTTITLPDSAGTIITTTATQTLTNKTLTTPVIASISNGGTINVPSGAGTIATIAGAQTLTNKTLTSPIINTPVIGTSLNDANANEFIKFTTTGSAVNELTIANGASTTGPTLSATGSGANLNIIMTPKGTGSVELNKAAFSSSTITANGAASTAATLIIGNKGSQLDVSLANGTTVGEYKIFTNKGAGAMHVTPASFAQGTKFVLAQNDGCTCIWDGTNWFLVGNQGEVTVS